jgi:hypothetical protein
VNGEPRLIHPKIGTPERMFPPTIRVVPYLTVARAEGQACSNAAGILAMCIRDEYESEVFAAADWPLPLDSLVTEWLSLRSQGDEVETAQRRCRSEEKIEAAVP